MISTRIAMYLAIFGLGIWTAFAFRAQTEPEYEFTVDWVTNNVENWTQHLGELRGKADLRALEIGSYEGRSAIWFLGEILTHPSSRITCVDLFGVTEIESRFDRNIGASGVAFKVDKIKGNSQDVLPSLGEVCSISFALTAPTPPATFCSTPPSPGDCSSRVGF